MTLDQVGRICHEVNRAYCQGLGDDSQPSWDDAPQWQRDSMVAGVRAIVENPTITPEGQHVSWMNDKIKDGWVFGSTKDPVAKTHPCLVAYDNLPREQQIKDRLFQAVVRSCWASLIADSAVGAL